MKDLVLHIRYLLTQYDCVVVPGWGALVVQHDCATFDLDNNVVTPPRRWISFNPLLAHNDGILAHSVMREQACTYEQAVIFIENQVAEWRDTLSQNKVVEWEKIGSFSKQGDAAMLFTEASDVEILASLSLLQPVSLPSLSQLLTTIEQEQEVAVDEAQLHETPHIRISWTRRAWQAVASVAVIVMVMLSISTPIDNFEATNDYAGLVAMEMLGYTISDDVTPQVQDTTSTLSENNPEEPTATDVMVEELAEVAPVEQDKPTFVAAEPVAAPCQQADELPRYILVIGSLPSASQAQEQIENFRQAGVNQDIKIYENAGKYRLYIDGYASMTQAQQRLDYLSTLPDNPFSGMWICSTRQ